MEITGAQRIAYVSGTPGIDRDSGKLPEDFAEQADLAWQNIVHILGNMDMGVEHIHGGDVWFGLWSGGTFFPAILSSELR